MIILFCAILLCVQTNLSIGQTIAGGEIYYSLISGKKYLVTANVYRICEGASLNGLTGYVLSDTLKIPLRFVRTEISRINDTCGNPCNIINIKSNPGYEKHVFTDTVDFNTYPFRQVKDLNLCKVKFSVYQQIRDTSYTTLSNGNRMFYLDAEVNICLNFKQVHSPVWSFEPKFMAATWQPFWYHPGPIDTMDFDSVSFELVSPMTGPDTTVVYNYNYNHNYPVTPFCPPAPGVVNCRAIPGANPPRGFFFDKEVCEFSYSPVRGDEIASIKIRAREWRKDSSRRFIEIGYVDREMRIKVVNSAPDNSPYITDPTKFSVCENSKLCLKIRTYDIPFQPYQNDPDTVFMAWNIGIPDAECFLNDSSAREKEMWFCWNAKYFPHNSKLLFGVKMTNKLCNKNLNSRGIVIYSKPQPKPAVHYSHSACDSLIIKYDPGDTFFYNPSDYRYNTEITEFGNNTILFTSHKITSKFHIPRTTTYLIKNTVKLLPGNCENIFYDTLYLTNNIAEIEKLKKPLYCRGEYILLGPQLMSDSPFEYKWNYKKNGVLITDTSFTVTMKVNKHDETIYIHAWDDKSCSIKDSIKIKLRGGFQYNPDKKPLFVCKYIQNKIAIEKLTGVPPFQYEWKIDGLLIGNTDSAILESFQADAQITTKVSDSAGCTYEDTLNVTALDLPEMNMRDTGFCKNSLFKLIPEIRSYPIKNIYYWYSNGQPTGNHDTFHSGFISTDVTIRLKLENDIGCNNEKQIRLKAWNLPEFNIVSGTNFNRYEYITMTIDSSFPSYIWSNGMNTQSIGFWAYSLGPPGTYPIKCRVRDKNGCEMERFVLIRTDRFTDLNDLSYVSVACYPNPFGNDLTIRTNEECTAEIMDLNGKIIMKMTLKQGENGIETNALSPGIYIVKVNGVTYKIYKIE